MERRSRDCWWTGLPTSNYGIFSPSKWVKEPSSEQACPPAITGSSLHPNGQRNPVQSRPAHQQSRDLLPIQMGKGTQFRAGLPTSNHRIFSPSKWVKEPSSEQACPQAITGSSPYPNG